MSRPLTAVASARRGAGARSVTQGDDALFIPRL
jgi:hypothetical protein